MGITHFKGLPIKFIIVAGGAAGALTATGVEVGDQLLGVINLTDGTDVLSEFSISDTDEIDNTGGTATTSDKLLVVFNDQNAA